MSREDFVRVTCDGCGKTQDCRPIDLIGGSPERRAVPQTSVPNGWLLVWATVKDEWSPGSGGFGTTIRPKPPAGNPMADTFHACSRSCASRLLDKLSSLLVGG